jgi:hypothetical protein
MPRAKPVKTSKAIAREIDKSYEKTRRMILDSMRETRPGTTAYLNHIKLLSDVDERHREERASRGLDPANLGAATKPQWKFTATVAVDDTPRRTAREQQVIEQFENEFPDEPLMPEPAPDTDEDESEDQ